MALFPEAHRGISERVTSFCHSPPRLTIIRYLVSVPALLIQLGLQERGKRRFIQIRGTMAHGDAVANSSDPDVTVTQEKI